jgi:O-antigen/teichoic acid export membrane protein
VINSLKTKLTELLGSRQPSSPFSAGGWAIATYIVVYALDALLFLPMARLLDPDDFGLYTLGTLISSGLMLVVQLNLIRALVRTPGDRNELVRATLWLSLLAGLLGALLCALSGLPMSFIYNNPQLTLILVFLAPGVLGAALGAVPLALLSRELNFRRRMLPETISVGVAAFLGLGAAFLGAGVYSLITYAALRLIVEAIVAWWVVRDRPEIKALRTNLASTGLSSFILHPSSLVPALLHFGLPASGGELALYARFNIDYAIAGLRLSTDALGVYNLAWKTTDRPSRLFNAFFDDVGYATFARLQTDRSRLTRVFLSATRLFLVLFVLIFLGGLFVRTELVAVLFGSKWRDVVDPLLPLFLLQGLWLIFHPSVGLILALGHSRLYAWINGLSLVLTSFAVLLGSNWGINGVAWAMLLATGATSLIWGSLALYFLRPAPTHLWQTVRLPLLFALTTLPAIGLTNFALTQLTTSSFLRLIVTLLIALIVFSLTAWRTWPTLRRDITHLREKLPTETLPTPPQTELTPSTSASNTP